ncbi:glycerophosphodiester phosphodiesterase [Thalassotalea fusca]
MNRPFQLYMFALLSLFFTFESLAKKPIVIAHRGASGYLPDHTLPAKAMAHAMGVDYIEQDIVMTKDDHLVVLHDLYLDNVSNVRQVYPDRYREDGHYYVIDFTLEELKDLSISSPFTLIDGKKQAKYPERYPVGFSAFKIHTFEDELKFLRELNLSSGKKIGIYPEIKAPWFHLQHQKDISKAVLTTLREHGYHHRHAKVYLQSFDPHELKRIKHELLPEFNMDIPLVQLIAETQWHETKELVNGEYHNLDYSYMLTKAGLEEIATYADGIGPSYPMLANLSSAFLSSKPIVKYAHELGMVVHPYTFRKDDLPANFSTFNDLLSFYVKKLKVDGVFTDFPDLAVSFVAEQ